MLMHTHSFLLSLPLNLISLISLISDEIAQLTKLKTLFLSNNLFDHVPTALAHCELLDFISFKSCRVASIAKDALPPHTRWLILTNNKF
jgi:Leucine-rich repeat (LRR) protein